MRRHREAMQRLEQTVADSLGFGRVEKLSNTEREFVSDEATRLCERWDDSAGLRERGPGTNPVLRAVADQFAIV